jgi:DNA-binding transcriptional regulator YhcF (GntR family)
VKIANDPPEHPYVQLAGFLRAGIRAGRIGPPVPSVMELADQSGLPAAAAKRARKLSQDEGVICAAPGRDTFVRRQGLLDRPLT